MPKSSWISDARMLASGLALYALVYAAAGALIFTGVETYDHLTYRSSVVPKMLPQSCGRPAVPCPHAARIASAES